MELFNVLNQRHNRLIRRWKRLGKKLGVPSLLCQHLQKDKNNTILAMFFYKLHVAKGVFMFLHFTHTTRAIIAWITAFRPSIDQYYPSTCLLSQSLVGPLPVVMFFKLADYQLPLSVDTWSICRLTLGWHLNHYIAIDSWQPIGGLSVIVRVPKSNSELQSLDWIVLLWLLVKPIC